MVRATSLDDLEWVFDEFAVVRAVDAVREIWRGAWFESVEARARQIGESKWGV